MTRLEIYCDGSCPKPYEVGGWAFVILLPQDHRTRSGHYSCATNQTMELCAALEALREVKRLKLQDEPITIISDSQYLVKGMLVWRETWIAQAYAGVENATWWRLLHHHQEHCKDLDFEWVKGHGSSRWNNYVDQMASQAQKLGLIDQQRRK